MTTNSTSATNTTSAMKMTLQATSTPADRARSVLRHRDSDAPEIKPGTVFGAQARLWDREPEAILINISVPNRDVAMFEIGRILCRDHLETEDLRFQTVQRAEELENRRRAQLIRMGRSIEIPEGHAFTGLKSFDDVEEFQLGIKRVDITPVLRQITDQGYYLVDAYAFEKTVGSDLSLRFVFKKERGHKYGHMQLERIWDYLARCMPRVYAFDNRDSEEGTLAIEGTHQYHSNTKKPYYRLDFKPMKRGRHSWQFVVVPLPRPAPSNDQITDRE